MTSLGNPVLLDALAWFDCAIASLVPGGDHDIIVGDVREAGFGAGTGPLLYYDGRYRELAT
jgi:flavin reductase (DIM6/NTAB) family NADH-FMN oxidoreductase RutF